MDVYRREAVAIEAGSGSDEAPWSHRFVRAERTPNHSCSIGGGCEATAAEYDSPIHSVFDTCPFPLFCSVFQTTCGDPHQFLLGQVSNVVVLPGVVELAACHQADPIVRLLEKAKNRFEGPESFRSSLVSSAA